MEDVLTSSLSQEKAGFYTDIEQVQVPKGLNEEVIRIISEKKNEPEFMLKFRLKAFRTWQTMTEPDWADINYPKIDFQNICYYSAPKSQETKKSLDEVDPELLETFNKLGIPLSEQKRLSGVAVDVVFDSVSLGTTYKEDLEKIGIIFCSMSEAIQEHPELVKKYLASVVPVKDNYYSALNSAVFSDGSFCYIPKGVKCPMDLSTYFRINAAGTGQFERTLIIAEEASSVNYLEGCTAPMRDENQLHAAVVEIVVKDYANVRYSTVQNWYAGDKEGKGGVYNFVTKRGIAHKHAELSWVQVEAGSAITWKYPSVVLKGDYSKGSFYSVALTNNCMQADTGTKMIHLGSHSKSTIISKGISSDESKNTYRGLVKIAKNAKNCKNYSQCDSMLIGDRSAAATFPYLEVSNETASVEHEASTSKINEQQLFYLRSRGIDMENAISMFINGFCKDVFKELPLEFSSEAVKLLELKLEHSIG